jgi:hypothetical protein
MLPRHVAPQNRNPNSERPPTARDVFIPLLASSARAALRWSLLLLLLVAPFLLFKPYHWGTLLPVFKVTAFVEESEKTPHDKAVEPVPLLQAL